MTRQLKLTVIGLLLFVWAPHQTAPAQGQAVPHDVDNAGQKLASRRLDVKLVSASSRDAYQNPEAALDGDPATEFTFVWGNGGAELVLDLREPTVVEFLEIVSGPTGGPLFLSEVNVGPDESHLQRDLLHRGVNLVVVPGRNTRIPLVPAVSRYLRLFFSGGGKAGIGEVSVHGRPHRPERHLCHWWSSDVKTDFLDAIDYLDHDLQVTDVWIDKVVTAFPSTRPNHGFEGLEQGGAFRELKQRGIHYWLIEDEGLCGLVNGPADLRDDAKWDTTLRRAREVYSRAKELGFRGLAMDAEDYAPPSDKAIIEKYSQVADHVDCWTFHDEFGYSGCYYQRGLQFGRVIKEVWDCPVIQYYEAVMYAGKPGCRDGNYWWLKGIHDAGIEIWIGTEMTYGRGKMELYAKEIGYTDVVARTHVDLPDFVPRTHQAYPFAARILPGFHPWITDFGGGVPNYLPKYLDEQLSITENVAFGCWIYHGGTKHAGDPRQVLNGNFLTKHHLAAADYLEVFRAHPTAHSSGNSSREESLTQ
jgi:hypothetical protein